MPYKDKEKDSARKKKYRLLNRDKVLAKERAWARAHAAEERLRKKEWRLAHLEEERVRLRVRHELHRKEDNARGREWNKVNKEKKSRIARIWRKAHPGWDSIKQARRLCAIPPWVDLRSMEKFYKEAAKKTRQTGIKHEVDHIWPLNGNGFNGLHVPWNLQILTKEENMRKFNSRPV